MGDDESVADGTDGRPTRRRFLAATAGLTAAAVAGCPESTDQTFEATPVVLPEDARRELALGETLLDSRTTTRRIDAVDGEVTLTSYAAAYTREKAFDSETKPEVGLTLLERFTGRVNGTAGPGAGRVVPGSALGVDEATLGTGDEQFPIPSDQFSLVVPAGAAGENAQPIPSSVMLLAAIPGDSGETAVKPGRTFVVDAADALPDGDWVDRGDEYRPSRGWFPGSDGTVMDRPTGDTFWHDAPTAVVLGDRSPEETFGVTAGEMPGERVRTGNNPFLTGNNPFLVAAPADVALGGEDSLGEQLGRAFDASFGGPIPGGATYGLGVLSTPNASVAGQSVNPLVQMPLDELVTGDAARELVGEVAFPGLVYEWADGPTVVGDVPDGTEFDGAAVLGEDAETATLGGVAHGGPGPFPWFVLVNAARVTTGDSAVVAAGVQRTPVPSADYPWLDRLRGGTEQPFNPFLDWARNGVETTGTVGTALDTGDADII